MGSLEELVQLLLKKRKSAKDIDTFVQVLANGTQPKKPFVTVQVQGIQQFSLFARSANRVFFTTQQNGNEFLNVAHYDATDTYPLPRWYIWGPCSFIESASRNSSLAKIGIPIVAVPPPKIGDLLPPGELSELLASHLDTQLKAIDPSLLKRINGRRLMAGINQTIVVHSPVCVLCGADSDTALVCNLHAGTRISLIFSGCARCAVDLKNWKIPLLEAIAKRIGIPKPFSTSPLSKSEMLSMASDCITSQLDGAIEKIVDCTITARRKSGFRLIFRLDAPDDYGYMILSPCGVEIARFDCADHHQVEGGPHHLHYDLKDKKWKKVVLPSYFVGSLLFDADAFLALLRLKETEWLAKEAR